MSWISPTGFEELGWGNEDNVYDEDTGTYGYYNVLAGDWTPFLVLTHNGLTASKLRYWVADVLGNCDEMDVDVYKDGAWVDVYQGVMVKGEWVEKVYAEGSVTKMRLRFHVTANDAIKVYETDFWGAVAGINISVAMHHYGHHISKIIRG